MVRRDKVHKICDVAAGGVGKALLARVVDGGGLDVVLAAVDLVALVDALDLERVVGSPQRVGEDEAVARRVPEEGRADQSNSADLI